MSRKRLKQYLMLLMAIGVIAVASSGGSFASFNAETTNPGNTFASGTLYLHNSANGNTACTSESATTSPNFNVNNNCDVLFSSAPFDGTAQTAHLELEDTGSLPSSDLLFKVGNCSVTANTGATGSSTLFGGALGCSNLYLTIQETQSDWTTDVFCAYGPTTNGIDCNAPNNTATLASPSSLTSLNQDNGSHVATAATLASNVPRYYVITVQPGSLAGNGNQWQNRKASFDMTWHIDQ